MGTSTVASLNLVLPAWIFRAQDSSHQWEQKPCCIPDLSPALWLVEEYPFLTWLTDPRFYVVNCIPYFQNRNKGSSKPWLLKSQGTAVGWVWSAREAHGRSMCWKSPGPGKMKNKHKALSKDGSSSEEDLEVCVTAVGAWMKGKHDGMKLVYLCIAQLQMKEFLWSQYN